MQRPNTLATLLAATTLALGLLGAASAVHATSPDWSRVDSARLEQLFWDCDARATREALSAGDGALCASLTDELKLRLFDGDFDQLLAWWRAGKAAEHARRGAQEPEYDEAQLQAP